MNNTALWYYLPILSDEISSFSICPEGAPQLSIVHCQLSIDFQIPIYTAVPVGGPKGWGAHTQVGNESAAGLARQIPIGNIKAKV